MERTHVDDDRPAPDDDLWSRGGTWVLAQFPLTALALLLARVGPTLPQIVLGRPAGWGPACSSAAACSSWPGRWRWARS